MPEDPSTASIASDVAHQHQALHASLGDCARAMADLEERRMLVQDVRVSDSTYVRQQLAVLLADLEELRPQHVQLMRQLRALRRSLHTRSEL